MTGAGAAGPGHCGEIQGINIEVIIVNNVKRVYAAIDSGFPKFNGFVESFAAICSRLDHDRSPAVHNETVIGKCLSWICSDVRDERTEIASAPSSSKEFRITSDEFFALGSIKFFCHEFPPPQSGHLGRHTTGLENNVHGPPPSLHQKVQRTNHKL